jgi:hypothetical protein
MIFSPTQKVQAIAYLEILFDKKCFFEIIKKHPKRTFSQNNYLHLILAQFSIEFGYEIEYTKQIIFKREVNKDIFLRTFENKKTGEYLEYYRSTADLDTKEMIDAIQKFRIYSSHEGCYLPEPNEHEFLINIQNNIEKYRQYL